MNAYIHALESFERDRQSLYGDIVLESFLQNDAMESIGGRVKSGWDTLRVLAAKILRFIKAIAAKFADAARKIRESIRKTPSEVKTTDDAVQAAEEAADRSSEIVKELTGELDELSNIFNTFTNSDDDAEIESLGEKAASISDKITKTIGKLDNGNESYTSATEAEGSTQSNIDRLKKKIQDATTSCSNLVNQAAALTTKINAAIAGLFRRDANNEDSNPGVQAKRQKALASILRAVSWIVNKAKSIPTHLTTLYGRVFKGSGAHITPNNGEIPNIG